MLILTSSKDITEYESIRDKDTMLDEWNKQGRLYKRLVYNE